MPKYTRVVFACLMVGALIAVVSGCGNKPVAMVNGQPITAKEFTDRLTKQFGKETLVDMINRKLAEDAFAKSGLKVDPADVDKEIMTLQQRFPSQEAFTQWLTQQGLNAEDLKKEVIFGKELELLCTKDVKTPSDTELQAFFAQFRQRYDKPVRVTISEIVLGSKAEADSVSKLASAKGANFADLARQHSTSTMFRDSGGRRPETPLTAVTPAELGKAAAAMAPGSVSQPIAVGQGQAAQWYIIKLEDRKPAEKSVFDKVKVDVLRDYKRFNAKQPADLLGELRKQAQVTVNDPNLQEVNDMFKPQAQLPTFGNPSSGGQPPAGGPQGQTPPAAPQGR